jgi:hypothetical protein
MRRIFVMIRFIRLLELFVNKEMKNLGHRFTQINADFCSYL